MATAEILAPESALALIQTYKPVELFAPGFIDPLIQRIKDEVRSFPTDISTPKGREAVASLAYKVGRSKTFIDSQRLALVADEKKRLKAIDAEGARVWDDLEALQKEVRKPLTDWEDAEKTRVADHEAALFNLRELSNLPSQSSVADIEQRIAAVEEQSNRAWQEFESRAMAAKSLVQESLEGQLLKAKREEADRIELARLRAENAERARVEREEQIAREAREKAEREAAELAAATAAKAEGDRLRIEREMRAAVDRAALAETMRLAEVQNAERLRLQAEAQAVLDREAAVAAERKRVEDAQRAEREAAEARENNKRHVVKINREVRQAMLGFLTERSANEGADAVIKAISSGLIPHTKISY